MKNKIFSTIEDWYYSVKNGIPNMFRWFKTVWAYRWWDYSFFIRVLIFMLKHKEIKFRTKGHSTVSGSQADQMKMARLLLERVLEFDYHENIFKHHDEKWGKVSLRFEPLESDNPHYDVDAEYSEIHIDRGNVKTPEDKEQERKEYKRLWKKPDQNRQRDLEYAMKIITKNLLSWWD